MERKVKTLANAYTLQPAKSMDLPSVLTMKGILRSFHADGVRHPETPAH